MQEYHRVEATQEKEKAVALEYLGQRKDARQKAAEDLAWSLLNSLEFVFNH